MSHWHTTAGLLKNRVPLSGVMVFDSDRHFSKDMPPDKMGTLVLRLMLCELAVRRANPAGFFVSVILPPQGTAGVSQSWAASFENALTHGGRLAGCPCLGLTLTKAGTSITIVMTAIGDSPLNSQGEKSPVLHSGYRLYVAGYLGDRYVGRQIADGNFGDWDPPDRDYFRHAYENPTPPFSLMAALEKMVHIPYLIRSGLRPCLVDLCKPVSLRFYLKEESIPLSPPFQRLAPLFAPGRGDVILNQGQDYALLLAAPPGETSNIQYIARRFQTPLTLVGHLYRDNAHD